MHVIRTGFPAKDDGKTSRLSFDAIYHPVPLPDRSGKTIPSFHRVREGLAMCHPALNMAKGMLSTNERDYSQAKTMGSFGIPLFGGVIETIRHVLDYCWDYCTIRAMVLAAIITISYCSLFEDMTEYLVFGDLCLRWIRFHVDELATDGEREDPFFPLKWDNAFKHLVVAIQSCAICIASKRANVHRRSGEDTDLNKQSSSSKLTLAWSASVGRFMMTFC